MTSQPTPESIPGMIEKIEQEMLLDLAEYVPLGDEAVVCEFGAYFGRSTRCLAEGLLRNQTLDTARRRTVPLHTYDIFSCSRDGLLARYVVRDAQRAGLEQLLGLVDGHLDFSTIFDHHMRDLPPRLVARHQTPLASAKHVGGPIALMHVDAPKWYEEYLQLLLEFGPHLRVGCQIVFQDYFYHWSASVIGATQMFIEGGLFEPLESAASSLLVRTCRPITGAAIGEIDRQFRATPTSFLLERAVTHFADFELDRRDAFYPRLFLAGVQHGFESGDLGGSSAWLQRLAKQYGGKLPPPALADLAELIRYGFSMRSLYELDTAVPHREGV